MKPLRELQQLLLAGPEGPPVAGLLSSEPAMADLLEALRTTGVRTPGELPHPDVTVPADTVPKVVRAFATALRDRLTKTEVTPTNAYDAVDVEVLGTSLRLRVRDPGHYALKRASYAHRALEKLETAGAEIHLLTLPHFDELDRVILRAVRDDAPTGAMLPKVLRRYLKDSESLSSAPETIAQLRAAAAIANDPAALDTHLSRLREWGLLLVNEGNPVAMAKLRRIKF